MWAHLHWSVSLQSDASMQLISLLPLLAVLLLHTVAAQVRQSWQKVNNESQRYHLQDEYDEYEYDPNAIEGKVTLIMDVKTSSFLFSCRTLWLLVHLQHVDWASNFCKCDFIIYRIFVYLCACMLVVAADFYG